MTSATPVSATFDREARRRFVRVIRTFLGSDVRVAARLLLGALVALLLGISGLNVVNSYVGRDFMTAIEHRDMGGFVRMAGLYAAVFVVSTVAAVLYRFVEERLGLLWREWLTHRLLDFYFVDQSYHRLKVDGVVTNPDQRIAEDVRTFTTTTLSLLLMLLNGVLTVLAFGGVLWAINRLLFAVAIGYAAVAPCSRCSSADP